MNTSTSPINTIASNVTFQYSHDNRKIKYSIQSSIFSKQSKLVDDLARRFLGQPRGNGTPKTYSTQWRHIANNVERARGMLDIREGGQQAILDNLQKIERLLIRAGNGIVGDAERKIIQTQIDQLTDDVTRIAETTRYLDTQLLADYEEKQKIQETNEVEVVERIEVSEPGGADIVFLIDKSGSMHDDIDSIIENASTFADQLKEKGVDARLGVEEFMSVASPKGPMRDEVEEFKDDLGKIPIGGSLERSLSALQSVVKDFSFRDDVDKFIVLVTDENADDDVPEIREDTINKMKEGDYTVFVVGKRVTQGEIESTKRHQQNNISGVIHSNPHTVLPLTVDYANPDEDVAGEPYAEFKEIVKETGGDFIDITSSDYSTILSRIGEGIITKLYESRYVIREDEPDNILKIKIRELADPSILVGPNGQTMTTEFPDHKASSLGIEGIEVSTPEKVNEAMGKIRGAIDFVLKDVGDKNAFQKTLASIQSMFQNMIPPQLNIIA